MANVFCPACDRPYPTLRKLKEHLDRARAEGEPNHIDIEELEGWDEPQDEFSDNPRGYPERS